MRREWTKEEIRRLKLLADENVSADSIAKLLKRSITSVQAKAQWLNPVFGQATAGEGEMSPSPKITGSPCTQADDDQLRILAAAGESCSIIAELSKRSHSSIRRRARMLKIKLARSRSGPKTKNTPRLKAKGK